MSLRVIQGLLGYKIPSTTARDIHLTPPTLDVVHATITALMADLYRLRSTLMPEVADVLRRYGHEYLHRFEQELLPSYRRAITDRLAGRAAAQALIKLAADPHDVGGLIGVCGVLHPWSRTLAYHPHVHGRVPSRWGFH